jgi:predicted MFS family arabinose efflux permease
LRYLFLLAVLPYVIDAWLIWTYPKELNQRLEQRFTIRHVLQETLASIRYVFTRRPLRRVVVDAAFFSATYKTSRDFLQPLLFTAALGTILVAGADADQNARMVVGLVFVLAQFLSVFATRYAYLLGRVMRARSVLHLTWVSTGVLVLLLGWWSDSVMVVLLVLASVYVAQNLRKPYTVEAIGERTVNERRSSVLSIESQLTSIAIIVAAPILGFLADRWTLSAMFALLGGALMVSRLFFLERKTHA